METTFNIYNKALQKKSIEDVNQIIHELSSDGLLGAPIPLNYIYGEQGTGKTRLMKQLAEREYTREIFVWNSTPFAIYSVLSSFISDYKRSLTQGLIHNGAYRLILDGYNGSDRKFNVLLKKFCVAGIRIYISTGEKPSVKKLYPPFQVYETGYPNFTYKRHFPGATETVHLNGTVTTDLIGRSMPKKLTT